MPLMAHEYMLCVTFVTSKIVFRHSNHDALKNVPAPTISEFYEILRASLILRDDSNGAICFVIRDLENKFQIFNRNNNFVIEITICPFVQKLKFLGSYIFPSLKGILSLNSGQLQSLTCICNLHSTMHVNSHLNLKRLNHVPSSLNKKG